MKTIRDVLRSSRFMREVSLLLLFFAALNALVSLLLFASRSSDAEVLASAIGSVFIATGYVVLAVMLRRGFVIALWIAGVLFALDTLLMLIEPSGNALGAAVVSRGILISVLIRYIRRERRAEP